MIIAAVLSLTGIIGLIFQDRFAPVYLLLQGNYRPVGQVVIGVNFIIDIPFNDPEGCLAWCCQVSFHGFPVLLNPKTLTENYPVRISIPDGQHPGIFFSGIIHQNSMKYFMASVCHCLFHVKSSTHGYTKSGSIIFSRLDLPGHSK